MATLCGGGGGGGGVANLVAVTGLKFLRGRVAMKQNTG